MNSSPLETPSDSKGFGCISYLLILLVGAIVVLIGGAFFAGRYALEKAVAQLGSTVPSTLPILSLNSEEQQGAQTRVDEFINAVQADTHGATLTLRGQELQGLLMQAQGEMWDTFKKNLFLTIEENHIRCDLSLPLGRLLLKDFTGKYISGYANLVFDNSPDGSVALRMESGKLGAHEFRAKPLGEEIKLLELVAGDPKARAELEKWLGKISKVEIQGGTLRATLK